MSGSREPRHGLMVVPLNHARVVDHPFLEGCSVAMEEQTRLLRENMQAALEGLDDEHVRAKE